MREAARRAAPAHARGDRRRPQGDRAAQPPRLVELPHLPLAAGARGSARSATSRSCCTARATCSPATTAATASACREVPGLRLGLDRPPRRRHRAHGGRPRRRSAATCFRLDGDAATPARVLAAFRRAREGILARHADGRQGPRLPRRRPRRGRRRRRDAALPGLPRRGADVRARHPARRPRRAAAGRRARARADDRRPTRRAIRFAARHDADGFLAARARAPRGAALPAVLDADPGRLLGSRPPAPRWPPRGAGPRAPAGARWARAAVPPARPRARAGRASRRRDRAAAVAQVGAAVDAVGRRQGAPRRRRSASTSTRSRTPDSESAEQEHARRARWRTGAPRGARSRGRPPPGARRSRTSASTAIRCCARRPGRSRASTTSCAPRSRRWARS